MATRKRFEEIRQGVISKEGKTHLSINNLYQIMAHFFVSFLEKLSIQVIGFFLSRW